MSSSSSPSEVGSLPAPGSRSCGVLTMDLQKRRSQTLPQSWCWNLLRQGLGRALWGCIAVANCQQVQIWHIYAKIHIFTMKQAAENHIWFLSQGVASCSGGGGTALKSSFSPLQHKFPVLWPSLQWDSGLGRHPHGFLCPWSLRNWYPKSWSSLFTFTKFQTRKCSHWVHWHFCFLNLEILHDWEILHLQTGGIYFVPVLVSPNCSRWCHRDRCCTFTAC